MTQLMALVLAATPNDDEYGFIWLIVGVLLIIALVVWLIRAFR